MKDIEETIKVETEVKFQVSKGRSKAVDIYGTGDRISHNVYRVVRKQMAQDIPKVNGGTLESKYGYSTELILKHNKEGVTEVGSFRNEEFAKIFCDALNKTRQDKLKSIFNEDEFLKSVI